MKTYDNPNDMGAPGKNAEPVVRFYLNPKTELDGCNSIGKADITLYQKVEERLRRLIIEVKTGAGTLDYNVNRTLDTSIPAQEHVANLMPNVTHVIYAPKYNGAETVGEDFWVFTREQFIAYLQGYKTKTGKPADMVKYTTKTTREGETVKVINLQEMNSDPKQAYLWNTLADLPTLEEWKAENR